MPNLKWTIGEVKIHQLVELEAGALIQSIIENATPKAIRDISWLYPHFADESGNLKALIQAFLIKSDNKNILIDACNGNDKTRTDIPEWANLKTNFLQQLEDIGVATTAMNVVACTHLHTDHVGWNTRLVNGVWVPTFPNAKYLFTREDYEYWERKPEKEIADDKAAFDDSVRPVVEAGLTELVEMDHRIDRNVSFIPAPGHTPGMVCVLIESQGQRAIISADVLHHPCQIAHPEWHTEGATFPEKEIVTRQNILTQIADTDTLLLGYHFANPGSGRVVRVSDGFAFEV